MTYLYLHFFPPLNLLHLLVCSLVGDIALTFFYNYTNVRLNQSAEYQATVTTRDNHKFQDSLGRQVLVLGFWWRTPGLQAAALGCLSPYLGWNRACVQFDILGSL